MARPRGRITVVCQNKTCGFLRKESKKDIVKRGFNRAGTQRYYYNHCNTYLVERSGTPLYRKRLSSQKIKRLCTLLVEKNGVRICGLKPSHDSGVDVCPPCAQSTSNKVAQSRLAFWNS